ncbi:MAG: cation:dicarboxylase symporter family transporter, partial [Myxococcaceae bacterium]
MASDTSDTAHPKSSSRLYLWVLAAIFAGGLLGHFAPATAVKLKPLGDAFISLVKMLIAPVIFLTVVLGVANVSDMKKVGRVGGKALLYFEVVSTFALVIGALVVTVLKPGAGFNADPSQLDAGAVARYAQQAHDQSTTSFLLHLIPHTFVDAFTGNGDLLQVLLLALLFGFALMAIGTAAKPVIVLFEALSKAFFQMIGMVMKLAPIGAGASMAFTLGAYGVDSLGPLMRLMGCFYLACVIFVLAVLGPIARLTGFSILRFLRYIRAELLLVLGTSSSESALVPLMQKLE